MVQLVDWDKVKALGSSSQDSAMKEVADLVDAALQHDGLLMLENVLTPQDAALFIKHAELFFSQPKQIKGALGCVKNGGFIRGYLSFGSESGQPDRIFEPKEGFSYGYDWAEDKQPHNKLQGPNKWPSSDAFQDAAAFREHMTRLFTTMTAVAEQLVRLIGMALGKDEAEMREVCKGGDTISLLRVFHYHPAVADKPECLGSSPHTDWGFLTVILQDGVGGLQFKDRAGAWHDVPCIPGSLVINAGDFLQIMSGGRYQSPVHKVLCPKHSRTSFVLFYYPDYETPLNANLFKPVAADYNTFFELDMPAPSPRSQQDTQQQQGNKEGDEEKEEAEGKEKDEASGKAQMCFGDYICRKWEQVQAY